MTAALVQRCAGCGWRPPARGRLAWRCAGAGDGGDHVLLRDLTPARLPALDADGDPNPFVRWRHRLTAWHVARRRGMADEAFIDMVRALDDAVRRVDGTGFTITPLVPEPKLGAAIGMRAPVWVKDETGGVSGSHKARHLFAILIAFAAAGRATRSRRLAIASCGNAALAAAVLARAADRALDVFIPPDADPAVVARLRDLGATIAVCPRQPGEAGDPCFLRFLEAVAAGALPFACQGPENGLAIEGGETLGWELSLQARDAGIALDRVFVQVGGGALASAVARGFEHAHACGAIARVPRLHPVQTAGTWPLVRAWDRVTAAACAALGDGAQQPTADDGLRDGWRWRRDRAALLASPHATAAAREALASARRDRARAMWPWEVTPHSVAHGILDDETYDWAEIVRATLATAGHPVHATEDDLAQASRVGERTTGIAVDATGSAGLAGLSALRASGGDLAVGADEAVAVLFTGRRRGTPCSDP